MSEVTQGQLEQRIAELEEQLMQQSDAFTEERYRLLQEARAWERRARAAQTEIERLSELYENVLARCEELEREIGLQGSSRYSRRLARTW